MSGPLSGPDREGNVRRAIDAAEALLRAGHAPFVPHLAVYWDAVFPHDEATWMARDLEFLAASEALLRLPGPSAGADIEEAHAVALGIPVFRSVADLLTWDREDELAGSESRPCGK